MDRKTLAAVVLCVAFLIFYRPLLHWANLDRYLQPAAPPPRAVVDTTRRDSSLAALPGSPGSNPSAPPESIPSRTTLSRAPQLPPAPSLEKTTVLETDDYRATFSNHGARLLAVELKRFAASHAGTGEASKPVHHRQGEMVSPDHRVVLAGGPLIALDLGSAGTLISLADLSYTVSDSLDAAGERRVITFTGEDPRGLRIKQTWRARPGDYALDLEVRVDAIPSAWRVSDYSLTVRSWPLLTDANLLADVRQLRATSLVGDNVHREHAAGLLKGPRRFDGNARWAAVQNRYFIGAVALESGIGRSVVSAGDRREFSRAELELLPAGTRPKQGVAINSLVVGLPSITSPVHRFVVYAGPCEYLRLGALKLQLERSVDLGWNWVLPFSKLLLMLLNWFYRVLHNYGVAIIVLATLVRALLHPLNSMSMRSMRAMQKIQPELERIKEKYKSDAAAMNTAVMALYKENKVNPAGGCLPMLVQMPLFIALYSVLYNAFELRQAPFVGWINDLSAPDLLLTIGPAPIRLLPILMLGSGLLSQRLTPSDPRQLPTMYMMNVFMLVFFYNLPSGLVLYWTVMNLLTAFQQWLLLRQDAVPTPAPVPVEAGAPRRRQKS
jgi:YidC/Oxa1 family membrane protein insertase